MAARPKSAPRAQASAPPARPTPLLPLPMLEKLLALAMARGADFAEVYVERAVTTAVVLEESKIKSAQTGPGRRAWACASSPAPRSATRTRTIWDETALLRAARHRGDDRPGRRHASRAFKVSRIAAPTYYRVTTPLADIDGGAQGGRW